MDPKTVETGLDRVVARIGAVPLLVIVALVMLLPGLMTLPPMDRDEPRFAQASKQMLETSDFVAIRFGEEARNKKPVGIYWLQAAAVRAAELAGLPDAPHRIWLYRLPSLLGAIASVLLTYWAALPLLDRRGALLAGFLFAATPLIGVEARLATTDAVLCATVAAALGVIARIFLADPASRRLRFDVAMVFWIAIGVGILIKGPITPLVAVLTLAVLCIRERSVRWLGVLRPLPGLLLCLLIVVPWFALILLKTHGAFLADAVGHDLIGKVEGGQEMHGAPPGFYLATVWLTAWPLAPFAAIVAPTLWRARRDPGVSFCLAWVVPAWLLFEAVPTKLVHYALPLYPALATLVVQGLARIREAGPRRGWIVLGLMSLVPVPLLGLVVAGQGRLWTLDAAGMALAVAAVALSLGLAWMCREALQRGRWRGAAVLAAAAAVPVYAFVYGVLLTPAVSPSLAVSPRLAAAAQAALGANCPAPRYATAWSREPSLTFATATELLLTDPAGAAKFLDAGPCRAAFIAASETADFEAALEPGSPVKKAAEVTGVAIAAGRPLDIAVYMRQGDTP